MTNKFEEQLFKEFLKKYLDKVKTILPESYRAQQLKAGNIQAELVYNFEAKFLQTPFLEALEQFKEKVSEAIKKIIDEEVLREELPTNVITYGGYVLKRMIKELNPEEQ